MPLLTGLFARLQSVYKRTIKASGEIRVEKCLIRDQKRSTDLLTIASKMLFNINR